MGCSEIHHRMHPSEKKLAIVAASCVLFNFVRLRGEVTTTANILTILENCDADEISRLRDNLIVQMSKSTSRSSTSAVAVRDALCQYFLKPCGELDWYMQEYAFRQPFSVPFLARSR